MTAVAFVGAGFMTQEHARAFAAVRGVELVGIHSRTRTRAEELTRTAGIRGVFDSVADMYEQTRADLVVVSVTETATKHVAKQCLAHPWTIMLEKPPGLDLTEAEEIAAAADGRDRPVVVALNRRFLSSTRAVLDDVARSDARRYIRVLDRQSMVEARAHGHPEAVVRNFMYANSIHVVDYLSLLGRGAVTSVERELPWNPRAPDVVLATVRFASGDVGVYEGIWNGPGPWAVMLVTEEKRWELRPLEQAAFQLPGERQLMSVPPHDWDREFKPGLRLQAGHAVAAARGERCEIPTVGESLRTMRLIDAIFRE
ncbi:MAG TPA: Gfo/Idh/MocA family oxidoreductase [Gaiellaceae bacterium]|nr:Gfo/Idh/MocA family oxidoreductase [Gaiellaceae bacterium]